MFKTISILILLLVVATMYMHSRVLIGPRFLSGAFYSKDATAEDLGMMRSCRATALACYEVACKAR